MKRISIFLFAIPVLTIFLSHPGRAQDSTFPGKTWRMKDPDFFGMNAGLLDSIAAILQGRGCIIKNGYLVKSWGDPEEKSDWLSSVKPLFSTFLFFAVEEGKIPDVHFRIGELGWDLRPMDRSMEFFHLANMISGYARPEPPGDAWAYNDFAIQLYQKSLFEKVFRETPDEVLFSLLGELNFQDHPSFGKNRPRLYASPRDFARIGLFWLHHGEWDGCQLLPASWFESYMKPQVPKNLPHTRKAETDDYLNLGSFGGGSDHFTEYGAGIYGFNWWFNRTGRLHPRAKTWPDAPDDTFMTIGAGGNNMVMIPGLNLILSSAHGNWGKLEAGNPDNPFNRVIRLLVTADLLEQNCSPSP